MLAASPSKHRPIRLVLVPLALLAAGCTSGDGPSEPDATVDEVVLQESGSETSTDPTRWYAFAFDREVTPSSGGTGKIQSFSYTNTREEGGKATVVDVDVQVQGVSTEPIRAGKIDMASGSYEPETVSTPLEVTKLHHTLTVVQDDTGERAPGETNEVTIYVPTGELPESSTVFWFFAKMEWTGDAGETGTWEYYVSPEMTAEQNAGRAVYTPFEEGSSSAWWGFELMASTYGLSMFSPFVTGAQDFEEGTFSIGGYSQDIHKETFTVGDYAFDGWSVEIATQAADSSGGWKLEVSEALPIPISYRVGSTEGTTPSVIAYELTGLHLA